MAESPERAHHQEEEERREVSGCWCWLTTFENPNFDKWGIIFIILHKQKQGSVNPRHQRSENMKTQNETGTGDGRKQG